MRGDDNQQGGMLSYRRNVTRYVTLIIRACAAAHNRVLAKKFSLCRLSG
jgi:hypothetical protein